jgi:hypothetical protein
MPCTFFSLAEDMPVLGPSGKPFLGSDTFLFAGHGNPGHFCLNRVAAAIPKQ